MSPPRAAPLPVPAAPLPSVPPFPRKPPPVGEFPIADQPRWMLRYRLLLLAGDTLAIAAATVLGFELRFGVKEWRDAPGFYAWYGLGILLGWLVALQYCNGYEVRHLATGPEESKRVLRASALTLAVLAIACYVLKTPLARGFVIGVIPLGALLLVCERALVRRWVAARRTRGAWLHRIVAVGSRESVLDLIAATERTKNAGLAIVGVCVEEAEVGHDIVVGIPVIGGILDAARAAASVDADVIAIASSGLGPVGVRELGWELEGTGRGMVMAPALTEIAGTRMHISPVEGLPLVWVEQPRMGRVPRLVKRSVDLIGGLVLLFAATPLLLVTALAIKLTSRGPVLFRQSRLGANGAEFTIFKFRSMYTGAEHQRADIIDLNEQDGAGVLFKIREDPRVTPVGGLLRKFSVDELPQLFNVVRGAMSLVGPRPLATEDSVYTGSARRRLLVRPGMTGLWQVSGRSGLSWEDAVRLDLYYVENWSLGLDLTILGRTIVAVLGRRGAY